MKMVALDIKSLLCGCTIKNWCFYHGPQQPRPYPPQPDPQPQPDLQPGPQPGRQPGPQPGLQPGPQPQPQPVILTSLLSDGGVGFEFVLDIRSPFLSYIV